MKLLLIAAVLVTFVISSASLSSAQILFGTFTPATTDRDKPSTFLALDDWLSEKGEQTKQPIRVVDIGWQADGNKADIEDVANNWRTDGAISLIKFMPYPYASWTNPKPDSQIANGGYDDYLDSFLSQLRDVAIVPKYSNTPQERRAYLAIAPQPNGIWFPWSSTCPQCRSTGQHINQTAADYVAMFNHIATKVRDPKYNLTEDKVQIVFIAASVDESGKMEDYFPNASLVNFYGVAGDNFGSALPGNSWTSASDIFTPMMTRLRAITPKPMLIASAASGTTPNGVTAKNTWIANLFAFVISSNVKLVTYYNAEQATDFSVFGGKNGASTWASPVSNSTYNVYPAFRDAVTSKPFVGVDRSNPRYISNKVFFGL